MRSCQECIAGTICRRRQRVLTPSTWGSRCLRCNHPGAILMSRTLGIAVSIPFGLRGINERNRIPVVIVSNGSMTVGGVSISRSPRIVASEVTAGVDTSLVEVLSALTPFDDRETLYGRSSAQQGSFLLSRLQRHFDGLGQLRKHVLRRHRLNREPLKQL